MVFKGLLVVISGFLFIFASGVPMRLIARFRPDYKREGIYWGVLIWIIAFFLGTFLQNIVHQIISGGVNNEPITSPWPFLLGAVLTTLFVQIGMLIFLKNYRKKGEDVASGGLALGFGIGLIAQVFTGMILITAGAGVLLQGFGVTLPFGNIQAATLELVSKEALFGLIAALLSLILFRVALLTFSAAQGYLVAVSMLGKKWYFWFALLGYSAFTWIIFFLQMLLGEENPGQVSLGLTSPLTSMASAVYYLAAFILGYRWLSKELHSADKKAAKARSK
ncbi:MAG: hypothetical protein Q8N39_05035 [Pelolinea sp.]|nr:hypothetical protein [Pelolinea sp.]